MSRLKITLLKPLPGQIETRHHGLGQQNPGRDNEDNSLKSIQDFLQSVRPWTTQPIDNSKIVLPGDANNDHLWMDTVVEHPLGDGADT